MFELGQTYTRLEIHSKVRGSMQHYLPTAGGRVACGCFRRKDLNPEAPFRVFVGSGPVIRREAILYAQQKDAVPIFLKRDVNRWEYVGMMRVSEYSEDPVALSLAMKESHRTDVTAVLTLEPA